MFLLHVGQVCSPEIDSGDFYEFRILIPISLLMQIHVGLYCKDHYFSDNNALANSADPDQTAPGEAV